MFMNCDKCTILMQNVTSRGNWIWDIWELCVLSSRFCCKSRSVLKKIKSIIQYTIDDYSHHIIRYIRTYLSYNWEF